MPVVPALIALSALTKHRKIWLILAMAGFFMQIPTLIGYPELYQQQLREQGIPQGGDAWKPALSPIVKMWPIALQQIRDARHEDLNTFRVYRPHSTTLADARNFRIVPLWWWMLPLVHTPRFVGEAISIVLVILGTGLIVRSPSPDSYRNYRADSSHRIAGRLRNLQADYHS
ncbi:MAG: hypothetical protein ACRD28_06180 [Acidobacteriaceae bacterium]